MSSASILVETDARGRANLSKFGKNARFLAREDENGTVILERAVVMTETEARFHRNPEAVAAVDSFIADESDVVTREI
ncbi:MAG: hypothetical protein WBG53_03320 [Rhodococcus sp. (in: high G+C Gram-positive bacteria)]|uniref:hypothetical protein n=1 Tax=unclassified Rhodococcus (in: high G+C Gram-positive bacteria) TaxID=192944 RepID=UPI000AAA7540|nr:MULTISPECIES: hypothetical protein [unclassified Rhodococcus (in: high G+C Gram-positive bacteria)]RMB76897.1 hypothetical protein AYK61_10725 [Rhodococcus sp. SBT000017]